MAQPMLSPGAQLAGRYRVDYAIASGGYATVYHVTDLQMGLPRALKEVTDLDPGIREQFGLEAKLLMTSHHPNIPRGYAHFEEQGRAYLLMDFVEGQDFEQLLAASLMQRGRPIDEIQALRWMIPICDALDEMHRQRIPIIHRDIKPANIKLSAAGVPILIDFGLAKLGLPGPTNQAAQGVTPGYAPPEQYLAQGRTDARSDIYSMGATLYTMLTGREPPEATNRLLAQTGNTGQPLVPARILNPVVSAATAHIIDRAMDVSPTQRQQSARELQDEFVTALDQLERGWVAKHPGEPTGPLTAPQPRVTGKVPARVPTMAPPPPVYVGQYPTTRVLSPSKTMDPIETPWFNLGGPLIRRMGKVALVVAAGEIYWGLLCAAALGAILGTNYFRQFPSIPTIVGAVAWLLIVLMLTALMVRAIDRSVARRGRFSTGRRWFQGTALVVLWLALNGVTLLLLGNVSPETSLLGVGFLGLGSILTGLLSAANVLS